MNDEIELPESVGTVVVGAGCVGCATAYHLAERGHDDVAVVDAGPIPMTGGSTVHAPGGLFQTTGSKTMTGWAKETRELYTDLNAYETVGGVEIATTEERLAALDRRMDQSSVWGLEGAERLSPAETAGMIPLLDPDEILGAYHMPTDGRILTPALLDGLRERAEDAGIEFYEHTEVTDVETDDGAVRAVDTDRGRIRCDDVLVASNVWAPLFGEMVDVEIPLMPCEHQYAVTESLDVLSDATTDIEHPFLRHQDAAMYFRQHKDGYGIGSYNHEPLLVDPADIDDHDEAMETEPVYDYLPGKGSSHDPIRMPTTRPFTEEHFGEPWRETTRILPALDGAEIEKAYNGMFCFTQDGMPIMGEAPDVDGFWIAAAIWLTHAGGVARSMAELMTEGTASRDISAAHVSRFQPHAGSDTYTYHRAWRMYDEVYDIHHPRESPEKLRELRTGPFYPDQQSLDAEFYETAGWERARWYGHNADLLETYDEGVPEREGWEARHWSRIEGAEHLAVRDGVGLCDLSNFTTVEITGPGATAFAQRMFTNDVDVDVGRVVYTPMLNDAGGIIGDMTVVRTGQQEFLVQANGGNAGTEQIAWLREHAPEDVTVTNRVGGSVGVGVWGPDARELLAPLLEADLSNDAFPYFTAQETYLKEVPVTALRVSFVGELGWELHTSTEYGYKLWHRLREAGGDDLVPMGDGALNTMRLEKGYRLYGADMTSEYTPYEAGVDFAVDLDTEFVGREALLGAEAESPDRRLTPLTLDDPDRYPTAGVPINADGDTVGYATSSDYGYSIGQHVLYGYLPAEHADPGTALTVQYENEPYDATVREEPLFDPDRERILR